MLTINGLNRMGAIQEHQKIAGDERGSGTIKRVNIVDHSAMKTDEAQKHLAAINREWLTDPEYAFGVTEYDQAVFDNPARKILEKGRDQGRAGGAIVFAYTPEHNQPIGVGAIIDNHDDEPGSCEIAKMGVYKEFRKGDNKVKGAGRAIFNALIEKAKELGYKKIVILSNSKLQAANNMYANHPAFSEVELSAEEIAKYTPPGAKESRADVKYEANIEDL